MSGRKLSDLASKIASHIDQRYDEIDADQIRDEADLMSGGELDCTQLDIVCDMVADRTLCKVKRWP